MSLQNRLFCETMHLKLNTLKRSLTVSNRCVKQVPECHYFHFRRKIIQTELHSTVTIQCNSICLLAIFKEKNEQTKPTNKKTQTKQQKPQQAEY